MKYNTLNPNRARLDRAISSKKRAFGRESSPSPRTARDKNSRIGFGDAGDPAIARRRATHARARATGVDVGRARSRRARSDRDEVRARVKGHLR